MRLLIAALLAVTSPVAAKTWPKPAAGASASGAPEILFTFDDGPSAVHTPKVLDILRQHRIKAVFFMVGQRAGKAHRQAPALIARILAEGHVIANHTMTHADLCDLDEATAATEIDGGKAAIEQVARVPLVWFRAPFGARCDQLEGQLAARGTVHMHWDLDPQEWRHSDPAETVSYVTRALGQARARNVLLLHDINPATAKALPEILAWITDENARRRSANQRPIRILQAPELALEQLPAGFTAWADDIVGRLRGLRADLASVLPGTLPATAQR